jgi:hypothetical protein
MTTREFSEALVTTTLDALKSEKATMHKWKKTADMWRAEGYTAEMFTADGELRSRAKLKVVLLSFTKLEQAIYAKPTSSLSDEERVTKRFVTTEMGSKLGKIVRHIRNAEKDEEMTDDERGARKVADLATRLKKDLTVWIEKIEKAEAVTFSATKMVETLKAASALIK